MDDPKFPYVNNLKYDKTLSLSDENFAEKLKDGTKVERRSKEKRMESVISYPEPLDFARFASAAYEDWQKDDSQSDYEKRLQLPRGWKLLTTASGLAFKDITYGYFGAAYWQPFCRRVVIAHRGTVLTNLDALRADVRGIFFHKYVKQMNAACTFTRIISEAIDTVQRERKTNFEIFFTGHSLGAWLAQVTTFSLKYLTLVEDAFMKNIDDGYHARAVVFDSPGCKVIIQKMIEDFDVRYAGKSTDAATLDITSYLSSPNFVNCCNPHVGKLYRVYPKITSGDYVRYTKSSHNMEAILETFQTSPTIKEVVDWPQIEIDLFEWKIWKLPENIFGGKEYCDFFHFATELNKYDPKKEEIKVDFELTNTNNKNKDQFVKVRYQTKPARTEECEFNVFTDSELEFLQRFQQITKIFPSALFEGEEMSEEFRSKISEKLNNLIINSKDRTIKCQAKLNIFQLIPYVKTLLRLYPNLTERAQLALERFAVRKQIYTDITTKYRHKIQGLTNVLLPSDWPNFGHFLDNELSTCHVLAEYGTDSAMTKVLKVTEAKRTSFTIFAFELPNLLTTETFFRLTEFLKEESLGDVLIAIECKSGTFTNEENIPFIKQVHDNIENGRNKTKLVIITDIDDTFNLEDNSVRLNHEGITWDELTNEAQIETMTKKIISFQGNSETTCLQNFIRSPSLPTSHSELAEILNPKTLMKFLKGDNVIVGPNLPALVEFYVPRKFNYPCLQMDVLYNATDDDVVAVLNDNQEILEEYHSYSRTSTKLAGSRKKPRFQLVTSDQDFENLCESNPMKNYHYLKMESNSVVWQRTKGSLNLIRENIQYESSAYSVEKILENLEKAPGKTLIISDVPGMGKSTVLVDFAKKLKNLMPDNWVIRINLNDCAEALNDAIKRGINVNNHLEAAKFWSRQIWPYSEKNDSNSTFERKLFEKSLTAFGGVILIFDGFDEISPDYEEIVIKLIKISRSTCLEKLVLSTRPHTKVYLEDQLSTLSRSMVPFYRGDQKEFLIQFWKNRLTEERACQIDLERRANESLDQLEKSISAADFLGIPFQCELLAEYILDKIINGENQSFKKELSLMDLYEAFVRAKINRYQQRKAENQIAAIIEKQHMRTEILRMHRQYALRLLLSGETWEELDYPEIEEEQKPIETAVQKAGLMVKTGENPLFVHRTLAEYFVLDYVFNLTKNMTVNKNPKKLSLLSRETLLQPEFDVLRNFLEGLIRYEKNQDETAAILRSFAQMAAEIWTVDKSLCLSRHGNTIFYVLLWEKLHSVFSELLKNLTEVCPEEIIHSLIETPGEKGLFPLHIASLNGHTEIASLFLEKGANLEVCTKKGATSLHVASESGKLEIVSLLLKNAANVDASMNGGETPLLIASNAGHLEIVRLLIDKGATVDACKNDGATPFYIAAQNGHLEIVSLFLEMGARIDTRKANGWTALHVASELGHSEVVNLLLEKGVEINAKLDGGWTPLHVASEYGHLKVVSLLLESGAGVDLQDDDGTTPLHVASYHGNLDVAELLKQKGHSVNAAELIGRTPLHWAASQGQAKLVEFLLQNEAKIEDVTINDPPVAHNETALHLAAEEGRTECVRLLVEYGANVLAKNSHDQTPSDLAAISIYL